jgi:hypothetical protein
MDFKLKRVSIILYMRLIFLKCDYVQIFSVFYGYRFTMYTLINEAFDKILKFCYLRVEIFGSKFLTYMPNSRYFAIILQAQIPIEKDVSIFAHPVIYQAAFVNNDGWLELGLAGLGFGLVLGIMIRDWNL